MQYVTATEAKQRLSALLDAAQSEPVTIRRQNRDVAVILSPKEYNRLRGMNIEEFKQFCNRVGQKAMDKDLTEEKLAKILEE